MLFPALSPLGITRNFNMFSIFPNFEISKKYLSDLSSQISIKFLHVFMTYRGAEVSPFTTPFAYSNALLFTNFLSPRIFKYLQINLLCNFFHHYRRNTHPANILNILTAKIVILRERLNCNYIFVTYFCRKIKPQNFSF